MSNELGTELKKIKRAVVGGYVKADMSGSGDWEVGRITHFDDKKVYFTSVVDGRDIWVMRPDAYKAKEREYLDFTKLQDKDLGEKKYDAEKAGKVRQAKDRAELDAEKTEGQRKRIRQDGYKCEECGNHSAIRMSARNEQGHTHRCVACGTTYFFRSKNLLEEYYDKYSVYDEKTASGRKCQDSGDSVAAELRGRELESVYELAATVMTQSEIEVVSKEALVMRYEHLNPGMQRMNLGNRIRKALKESDTKLSSYT